MQQLFKKCTLFCHKFLTGRFLLRFTQCECETAEHLALIIAVFRNHTGIGDDNCVIGVYSPTGVSRCRSFVERISNMPHVFFKLSIRTFTALQDSLNVYRVGITKKKLHFDWNLPALLYPWFPGHAAAFNNSQGRYT